ncbi:MAG TPA: SdiA-regulated domain-containing protein [Gemmatimonadales bacterium]|nr:SdiA-regulated domain-containing protein [Gemmatimonadales bacterium]
MTSPTLRIALAGFGGACAAFIALGAGSMRLPASTPASASVLARYDLGAAPTARWKLPRALDEISGLATDATGRLFAHDDEQAIIYELDASAERIVRQFAFGRPPARGDFEGIAVAGTRVFLTTSSGIVYAGATGANGTAVPFSLFRTGIGRSCEIEGLAWNANQDSLLFACKAPRISALRDRLAVFAWSPARPAPAAEPAMRASLRDVADQLGHRDFLPSELLRDPDTGHLLLLAARAHAIVEITPQGDVVNVSRLQRALHRQPEGLAFDRDGALLISDEANGGRATLTTYRRAR